jgi:cell fate regulator YaaT (PSP1 superfamily)
MTIPAAEANAMSGDFPESDWKVLRAVKDAALNRLCERILGECRRVMDAGGLSAHQRYLKLFKLLHDRDDDIAMAFNDMRRSRALNRISWMYYLKLLTDEEWDRFSPQTRETALFLAGMIRD